MQTTRPAQLLLLLLLLPPQRRLHQTQQRQLPLAGRCCTGAWTPSCVPLLLPCRPRCGLRQPWQAAVLVLVGWCGLCCRGLALQRQGGYRGSRQQRAAACCCSAEASSRPPSWRRCCTRLLLRLLAAGLRRLLLQPLLLAAVEVKFRAGCFVAGSAAGQGAPLGRAQAAAAVWSVDGMARVLLLLPGRCCLRQR